MAGSARKPGQAISGMDIGRQIADALGLPAGTNLIQIRIGLDEAIEVICRYYPTEAAMMDVKEVIQSYHLVPASAPYWVPKHPPMNPDALHSVEDPHRYQAYHPLGSESDTGQEP